jgi:hypothetical protein
MQAAYDLAPVIADVISAHCPGTSARQTFIRACFLGDWVEAKSMVEGMLAEPWVLRGYQEARLREFLDLLPVPANVAGMDTMAPREAPLVWSFREGRSRAVTATS